MSENWSTIPALRARRGIDQIEVLEVLSGRWKRLSDPYWDTCVIQVRWRYKN
jgi:hypothetical protein